MIELTATVRNINGIHCRPASMIAKHVGSYDGAVLARYDSRTSDLRTVLGIMMLELHKGAEVTVQVEGRDEQTVCRELVDLLEKQFDFPPGAG